MSVPKRNNNDKNETTTIINRKIDCTQYAQNIFHALSHLIFTLNNMVLRKHKNMLRTYGVEVRHLS